MLPTLELRLRQLNGRVLVFVLRCRLCGTMDDDLEQGCMFEGGADSADTDPSCGICLEHVGIDAIRLMGCCFGVVCAGCLPQIPLNDGQRLCPLCREPLTTSAVVSDSSSSSALPWPKKRFV